MLSVTVVIPHLNQEESLARCLASLARQKGDFALERIYVVDNGSAQAPSKACSEHPEATLLREPTPGPGPARNLGVAAAKGDILAFIDADCEADERWLSVITATFSDHPAKEILGGDVRILRRRADRASMTECYESVYAYRMREYIAKQGFTGTGNLAVRAETMRAVGPFAGLHVAEDRDWGRRASARSIPTHYVPEMIIYHPARESFDELATKWNRQIAHDHEELGGLASRLKWVIKAALLLASPIGEIPRIATSDRIAGARERALAWACLLRIRAHRAATMTRLTFRSDARDVSATWNRKQH